MNCKRKKTSLSKQPNAKSVCLFVNQSVRANDAPVNKVRYVTRTLPISGEPEKGPIILKAKYELEYCLNGLAIGHHFD